MMTGGKMAIDDKTGVVQIEDNGKYVDSANKVIVLGNQIMLDRKNNSFLATRKPVMVLYSEKTSTYIAADTLFRVLEIRQPDQPIHHGQGYTPIRHGH